VCSTYLPFFQRYVSFPCLLSLVYIFPITVLHDRGLTSTISSTKFNSFERLSYPCTFPLNWYLSQPCVSRRVQWNKLGYSFYARVLNARKAPCPSCYFFMPPSWLGPCQESMGSYLEGAAIPFRRYLGYHETSKSYTESDHSFLTFLWATATYVGLKRRSESSERGWRNEEKDKRT